MNFKDFRSLDEEDQYIILWEKAIQVGEREDYRFHYALYQLNNFYIEIKCPHYGGCKESLKVFSQDRRLQPYLEKIDLAALNIINF